MSTTSRTVSLQTSCLSLSLIIDAFSTTQHSGTILTFHQRRNTDTAPRIASPQSTATFTSSQPLTGPYSVLAFTISTTTCAAWHIPARCRKIAPDAYIYDSPVIDEAIQIHPVLHPRHSCNCGIAPREEIVMTSSIAALVGIPCLRQNRYRPSRCAGTSFHRFISKLPANMSFWVLGAGIRMPRLTGGAIGKLQLRHFEERKLRVAVMPVIAVRQ